MSSKLGAPPLLRCIQYRYVFAMKFKRLHTQRLRQNIGMPHMTRGSGDCGP